MASQHNVLVTGVGGYWGSRVAARLLSLPDMHVIGIDAAPLKEHLRGLDFIQTDVRNPLLSDLLAEERVDTICHLAFVETDRRSESAFDHNVMGTMKVFGAAAVAGVKKLIVKSSTMTYGARPDNSAFLMEQHPLATATSNGSIADLVEIESFCNGFRGQNPDVTLTVLRFPGVVGPTVDSPLTRFLGASLTPFLMGFDPMMQVIHEGDVVEALVHAVLDDFPGVFNVAAEDVLPLSRVMGLAGTLGVPIFHLAAYWANPLAGSLGVPIRRLWPIDLDYLRYPWVGDLSRMRAVLNFTPRYTAAEALREFAGRKRLKDIRPDAPATAYDEERLRDTIERRRRARERLDRTPDATLEPDLIAGDGGEEAL